MKKFVIPAILICLFALCSCARTRGDEGNAVLPNGSSDDGRARPRIASMAPSFTAIISRLGLADELVAVDERSATVTGVSETAIRFDMMKPDVERLAALEPDILFVSTITQAGTSQDPFKPLSEAGATVVYIPTNATIAGIEDDIRKIADLVGRVDEGKALAREMNEGIERISTIARTIPEEKRRTVVFEISAAPYIYSFGRGVYLDELLMAAGAINAFERESGWISVSAETILAANPNVILTNTDYLPDPVAEICARPGWSEMRAVREGRVYRIDSDASSQPGPEVVRALGEIAKAVYPEYFK